MIPFQLRTFLNVTLFPDERDERNPRRAAFRLGFGLGFGAYELIDAALLALDHLFFPDFPGTPVTQPLFVIGNPRSGTTHLQRLLALDDDSFSSVRTWQMMFPSISAQKLVQALAALDRRLGGRLRSHIRAREDQLFGQADRIHRTRLDAPEEDEGFLIHAFASAYLLMVFPSPIWARYQWFDQLPDPERSALMAFYRACIQRHLYLHGRGRRLLSKNPLFTTKIRSLYQTFPDARVVYVVRDPADALSSLHDMLARGWRAQGLPLEQGGRFRRPGVLIWSRFAYAHALKALDDAPAGSHVVVRYDDLVADPKGTVERIYQAFGLPMSAAYGARLDAEAAKAKRYRSEHPHSLEQFDLSHAEVEALMGEVYERFGFPRRSGIASTSSPMEPAASGSDAAVPPVNEGVRPPSPMEPAASGSDPGVPHVDGGAPPRPRRARTPDQRGSASSSRRRRSDSRSDASSN